MSEQFHTAQTERADPGQDTVSISVNGLPILIHRGHRAVSEIKQLAGVLLADVLAQVIDGELTDLADDGHVVIKGGEEFHSHPRDSGASRE